MVTNSQHNKPPTEQQILSFQDKLLSGVAEAASRLLEVENFDQAVNGALEAIAHATNIDHIAIYNHHVGDDTHSGTHGVFSICLYEWTVARLRKVRNVSGQFLEFYDDIAGSGEWLAKLQAGCPIQKLIRKKSKANQSEQESGDTLSVLRVPIFVGGTYWGNFGFDCTTQRIWNEAEIAVLRMAAAFIGGAIVREGNHRDREAVALSRAAELETDNHELRVHGSLLECVNAAAQCLIANDDLALAFPAVLQILGEGIPQCRVYILRNSHHNNTGELIFNLHAEWDSPSIPRKMNSDAKFPITVSSFPTRLSLFSKVGQAVQFFARELDGIASENRPIGQARSLLGIPIRVAGVWWGLLGFDDCEKEYIWADAEIAILETAATAIGNSLERDRTRRAHEAEEHRF